jgi:hypothetical protein
MHIVPDFDQKTADLMEAIDHGCLVKNFLLVIFDDFLSSLQGISFNLHQLVDEADFLNVFLGETSVSLLVLFGLDDVKFPLPIPD